MKTSAIKEQLYLIKRYHDKGEPESALAMEKNLLEHFVQSVANGQDAEQALKAELVLSYLLMRP